MFITLLRYFTSTLVKSQPKWRLLFTPQHDRQIDRVHELASNSLLYRIQCILFVTIGSAAVLGSKV